MHQIMQTIQLSGVEYALGTDSSSALSPFYPNQYDVNKHTYNYSHAQCYHLFAQMMMARAEGPERCTELTYKKYWSRS